MRLRTTALAVALPALLHIHLHIHLHHQFHGPPFDYAGLAAASFASWVGVPGPGEPVLIAAGVLAAKHKLALASVLFVAFVAATAGGIVGWLVGLKAGRALVTAPGPLRGFRVRAVERGEEVFRRYPVVAIVLTPPWMAGIHGVRAAVYQPVNAVTALAWTCGFGLGGYFVGPAVLDAVADLGVVSAVGLGLLIALGVWLELRRRYRRGRS